MGRNSRNKKPKLHPGNHECNVATIDADTAAPGERALKEIVNHPNGSAAAAAAGGAPAAAATVVAAAGKGTALPRVDGAGAEGALEEADTQAKNELNAVVGAATTSVGSEKPLAPSSRKEANGTASLDALILPPSSSSSTNSGSSGAPAAAAAGHAKAKPHRVRFSTEPPVILGTDTAPERLSSKRHSRHHQHYHSPGPHYGNEEKEAEARPAVADAAQSKPPSESPPSTSPRGRSSPHPRQAAAPSAADAVKKSLALSSPLIRNLLSALAKFLLGVVLGSLLPRKLLLIE